MTDFRCVAITQQSRQCQRFAADGFWHCPWHGSDNSYTLLHRCVSCNKYWWIKSTGICENCRWQGATREVEYVYVIAGEGSNLLKIGRARDVEKRLRDLTIGSPVPLRIVYQQRTHNAKRLEKRAHERLDDLHVRGEWFNVEEHVAIAVVRDATR